MAVLSNVGGHSANFTGVLGHMDRIESVSPQPQAAVRSRPSPKFGENPRTNSPTSEIVPDEDGKRRFDGYRQRRIVRVGQGNIHISADPDIILDTVLGSCIAACIRDPVLKIGGMNHFLLPRSCLVGNSRFDPLASRYGIHAMELLINGIMSKGGQRNRLEVKLFGGGNVVRGISGIGHENADFIERFMRDENLSISSMHLRGTWARRIEYSPVTGRARMMLITGNYTQKIHREEMRHVACVAETSGGDIELFD